MHDCPQLARLKGWQRARVLALQEIMEELAKDLSFGNPIRTCAQALANKNAGRLLPDEGGGLRVLPISKDSLVQKYYQWLAAGRSITAFVPKYAGSNRKIPDALVTHIHRECTKPGVVNNTPVFKNLKRDWRDGKKIDGLGTWQEWWKEEYPELPLPEKAPDFPISDKTLYNYAPKRALRTRGNKGLAAARKEMPTIRLNYSNLKPGELYVFDDVRLDLIGIDDITGFSTEVKAYIAYEAGCRIIPSFVLRPANAFVAEDIDELVMHALQTMGLCREGITKLIFERGTLTWSVAAAALVKKVSGGRICAIRNGVDGEVAFDGAPHEAAKGHWMGKAVIESLMRSLHLALMTFAGQRGNNYNNQPGSLGWVGQGSKPRKGTLVDEAEKLAQIDIAFNRRLKLDCGIMFVSEIRTVFLEAIKLHNSERGHAYQGFGKLTLVETAPGVWEDAIAS